MTARLPTKALSPLAPPFVPKGEAAAGPSSPKSRPLNSAQELRLGQFLAHGRPYAYYAEINPKSVPGCTKEEPLVLSYDCPLIPFLRELKEAMTKIAPIKGIYLQGGAALKIIKGSSGRDPADLDLSIEIDPPGGSCDWPALETALLETLENRTGIYLWQRQNEGDPNVLREYVLNEEVIGSEYVDERTPKFLFSGADGARLTRMLVRTKQDEFAIHSLPTSLGDKFEPIDTQIVYRSQNSCYTSAGSVRIKLDGLLSDPERGTASLEAVDGYNLDEALELIAQGSFVVQPERISSIFQGLLGYCRTVSRGYHPQDPMIEISFWQSWMEQMTPDMEKNFASYLEKHFNRDLLGKAVFLLNFGEIIGRCRKIGEEETPEAKRVQTMAYTALSDTLGSDFDSEKDVDDFLHEATHYLSSFQPSKELRGPNKQILDFIPITKKGNLETHYLLASRREAALRAPAESYELIKNDPLMTRLIALLGHDDADLSAFLSKKAPAPAAPREPIDLWIQKVKDGVRGIECSPHFLCSKNVLSNFKDREIAFLTHEIVRTVEELTSRQLFREAVLLLKIATESERIIREIDPDQFNRLFQRIFQEQTFNQAAIPIYRAYVKIMGPVAHSFQMMAHLVSMGHLPSKQVFGLTSKDALRRPDDFGVYQEVLSHFLMDHPQYEGEILACISTEYLERFTDRLSHLKKETTPKEPELLSLEKLSISGELSQVIESVRRLIQEGKRPLALEELLKAVRNDRLVEEMNPDVFTDLFQTLFSSGFINPAIISIYRTYAKIHGPVLDCYRFLIHLAQINTIKLPSFYELASPSALSDERDFHKYAEEIRALLNTHPKWAAGLLSHAPVLFIQSLENIPTEAFDFLTEKWGLRLFLTEEGRIDHPFVLRLLKEAIPKHAAQIYEMLEEKKWERVDSETLDFFSLMSHQSPRPPLGMQNRCVAKMIDLLVKFSDHEESHQDRFQLVNEIGNHSKMLSTGQAKRFASIATPFAHLDPTLASLLTEMEKRRAATRKEFQTRPPIETRPIRSHEDQVLADLKEKKINEKQLYLICLEMKQSCMKGSQDFRPLAKIFDQANSPNIEFLTSKCDPENCCLNSIDFSLDRLERIKSRTERKRLKSYLDLIFQGVKNLIVKAPRGEPLKEITKQAVLRMNRAFQIAGDDSIQQEMTYSLKNLSVGSPEFNRAATQVIRQYVHGLTEDQVFDRILSGKCPIEDYIEALLLRNPKHFLSIRIINELCSQPLLLETIETACATLGYWVQLATIYRALNESNRAIYAYKKALEEDCPEPTRLHIYREMRTIYDSKNDMEGLLELSELEFYHYFISSKPMPDPEFKERVSAIKEDPIKMESVVLGIISRTPEKSAYTAYLQGLLSYEMMKYFKDKHQKSAEIYKINAIRMFDLANKLYAKKG